jgi:G3E family GTPase
MSTNAVYSGFPAEKIDLIAACRPSQDLVLRWLPVSSNAEAVPVAGDSPIKSVLRSKGFVWMSNSHATAFYWSHAGQHFEIRDEGDWWAAIDDEDWPADPAQQNVILGALHVSPQKNEKG